MKHMPKSARVAIAAIAVVAVSGGAWLLLRDPAAASAQSTNFAYVHADFSTIAPRVSGTVIAVTVEDNQAVKAGDLLARLDDRDFRVALSAAQADLDAARAMVARLEGEITRQASLIVRAGASVSADEARIRLARANAERYRDLASDGSASRQEREESEATLAAQLAAVHGDEAAHRAAREQVPMLRAELEKAKADVARSEAALAAARLNLSYTEIRAPIDGIVARRSVRLGNYVHTGDALLAVVPVQQAYVEANFRETEMRNIRAGQPVSLAFDMLPGVTLKGHVESVAPATGVSFAAIAPENASGNFTKITQRLPVRIAIDPGQAEAARLRVGMSVVPTIETGPG